MENAGVNPAQIALAFGICATSFVTLYLVPHHCLNLDIPEAYWSLNILLLSVIIGVIFMSQVLTPELAKMILSMIFMFSPKDRIMSPLILKNLESHAIKNMKANLMYTTTICFLVYSATNF